MKFAIVFAALFALAIAAPYSSQDSTIVRSQSDVGADQFNFDFETSDGASQQAQGQLKQFDEDNFAVVQSGSYKYIGDDGQTYVVDWTADEKGFHPKAAHLPVA